MEYYAGKTTGNQLLVVFREEVEAGRRERHPRKISLNVPYNRIEGDRIMKRIRNDRLRDSLGRYRARLSATDFSEIRLKHFDQGKRICDLAREYPKYCRETIRRVLGRGRGYILVKGIGRVETTDTTLREPSKAHPETDR